MRALLSVSAIRLDEVIDPGETVRHILIDAAARAMQDAQVGQLRRRECKGRQKTRGVTKCAIGFAVEIAVFQQSRRFQILRSGGSLNRDVVRVSLMWKQRF